MAGMVPKDVYELTGVADPRLSPDGSTVACVVGTVDQKENEYRAAIWLATVDGSQPPRRFTSGEKSDADPRWSPDGSLLAFTSDRADKASQLYVMPVAGGEPRKLTSLKEDVTQAVWSPDGTRIAFVARVRDAAYEEDARKRAPRRLTRLQYKLDSVGWTADRRRHLFVVPADGSAEPVQLTEGDCEDHSPAWSPDGRAIAFISARHDDWDLEMVNDVYLVDAAGGEPRRLTQGAAASAASRGRRTARVSRSTATRACSTTPGTARSPSWTSRTAPSRSSRGRWTSTAPRTRACASRCGTATDSSSSSRTTVASTCIASRRMARTVRA